LRIPDLLIATGIRKGLLVIFGWNGLVISIGQRLSVHWLGSIKQSSSYVIRYLTGILNWATVRLLIQLGIVRQGLIVRDLLSVRPLLWRIRINVRHLLRIRDGIRDVLTVVQWLLRAIWWLLSVNLLIRIIKKFRRDVLSQCHHQSYLEWRERRHRALLTVLVIIYISWLTWLLPAEQEL
jgi:hypothetical protein